MADEKFIKAPSNDGDYISVYFQSTRCAVETKTSKSGKTYRNFIFDVIVAGESEVVTLAIYEKNQEFLDQLAKFNPTKDDLCLVRAKSVRTKTGVEFSVLTLEIPSKGLGGQSSGAIPYQGETKEERGLRNIVISSQWAIGLVYKSRPEWFTSLDHDDATEEQRLLAEGLILKEVEKINLIRDKVVQKRVNQLVTKKQHETNQGGGSDNKEPG